MARTLTSDFVNETNNDVIKPFLALEVAWPSPPAQSSPVRLWTGWGDIVFGGFGWNGLGDLLQITPVEENDKLAARGLKMSLDGLDSDILDYVLGTDFQGNDCALYLGFLDDQEAVIDSPVAVFEGYLDSATINESPSGAVVQLTAESKIYDFVRKDTSRYTVQDQESQHGITDKCFEFLPNIGTETIAWGNHKN